MFLHPFFASQDVLQSSTEEAEFLHRRVRYGSKVNFYLIHISTGSIETSLFVWIPGPFWLDLYDIEGGPRHFVNMDFEEPRLGVPWARDDQGRIMDNTTTDGRTEGEDCVAVKGI